MKIYTKSGDKGLTSLIGGTRVPKSSLRIDCYGTVDELNSYLGLLRDQEVNAPRREVLKEIQDRLFTIGSHLATDPAKDPRQRLPDLHVEDVDLLETEMDRLNEALPELREFVLPGGHQSVSFAHVARCVCRRAERTIVALGQAEALRPACRQYVNRLSDLLFVLARVLNRHAGGADVLWQQGMNKG